MAEETPQEKLSFNPTAWAQANPALAWFLSVVIVTLFSVGSNQTVNRVLAQKGEGQSQGISQDQADIRYLSKDEAERRRIEGDKQVDEFGKRVLTKEVFEAYHKADQDRMERMEKMLERILEK